MQIGQIILQALMLSTACSLDCLITGFAYGVNKIKIPFIAAMAINIICSLFFGAALLLGSVIGKYIPEFATLVISVTILTVLGLIKLAGGLIKNMIRRRNGINKDIKFSFLSLKFIINISANPEDADTDLSKTLSVKEAIPLSIALAADCIPVGIGMGMVFSGAAAFLILIGFSLVTDLVFLLSGQFIGAKIAKKTRLNLSWVGGLLLIGLAVLQFFL